MIRVENAWTVKKGCDGEDDVEEEMKSEGAGRACFVKEQGGYKRFLCILAS